MCIPSSTLFTFGTFLQIPVLFKVHLHHLVASKFYFHYYYSLLQWMVLWNKFQLSYSITFHFISITIIYSQVAHERNHHSQEWPPHRCCPLKCSRLKKKSGQWNGGLLLTNNTLLSQIKIYLNWILQVTVLHY